MEIDKSVLLSNKTLMPATLHPEKSILNLFNSNKIWIVITNFRLIWYQTEFRLVPNQSGNGNYNPNLVWIKKIWKIYLYSYCEFVSEEFCPKDR